MVQSEMMEGRMSGQGNSGKTLGLDKMPTGIEGFDEITRGGLPRGRTSLVVGGPGSGKTVFALQTLVNGARQWAEPGIFVAFEENSRQIAANAATFGWDLEILEKEKLFFFDARMALDTITAGQFDLTGLLVSLQAKVQEMGAKRIVFDSMDVLLGLLENPVLERREIYRVHEWLSGGGLTGLLNVRVIENDPLTAARYGFVQFMADCVVSLTHPFEDRTSLRSLRIVKYRGSGFAENEFPFAIGSSGIEVGTPGQIEHVYRASTERVSTGIERLDLMLKGGLYRGSSLLISGAPGTAKSTLSGAFIEAACLRGEQALYISFDEAADEVVRNLASVNIQLAPYLQSGLLRIYSARSEVGSAEEHLMRLKRLIAEHKPRCMAIDPLSAMIKAGGRVAAFSVVQRLLNLSKTLEITLFCTSLLAESDPEVEGSSMQISTIADSWIHLSYVVNAGERNRALTIIKSRGTRHSNQLRELVLSDEGVTLADVYTAGGQVLMGTLRWEKEEAAKLAEVKEQAEFKRKGKELELAEAQAKVRLEVANREIEALQLQKALLEVEERARQARSNAQQKELQKLRRADPGVVHDGAERQDPPIASTQTEVKGG
jgi:circadian clock protein KaiC